MNVDNEQRPELPRSPEAILQEVGLRKEDLIAKAVLFVGNGSESLSGAELTSTNFDMQFFLATTETGVNDADFAVVVRNEYADPKNIMGNPDREDLFAAIARSVHNDGEVRMVVPGLGEDQEYAELLVDNLAMLLDYNYGLERSITSVVDEGQSYIKIQKKEEVE